jgi:hypothetical protein
MSGSTARPPGRYGAKPDPGYRRLALAPGLIAALALVIGSAILEEGPFEVVRYVVAIFAAIVAVFAVQAKQWWWLPFFAAIVVLWQPVFVVPLEGDGWRALQFVAAIVFLLAGWLIKVPIPEDQRR